MQSFPVAAFESISTLQRLRRISQPYVALQYAASDFYPITLCEVCGHAGHSAHNRGCHLWCDILQHFSIAYAYGSHYELFKGFLHTEEWGARLYSKQIFCSPSSEIWSVGYCKGQIITRCPLLHLVYANLTSQRLLDSITFCHWQNLELIKVLPHCRNK